jgi:hypothetical protein
MNTVHTTTTHSEAFATKNYEHASIIFVPCMPLCLSVVTPEPLNGFTIKLNVNMNATANNKLRTLTYLPAGICMWSQLDAIIWRMHHNCTFNNLSITLYHIYDYSLSCRMQLHTQVPCNLVVYRRFTGACCLHNEGDITMMKLQ